MLRRKRHALPIALLFACATPGPEAPAAAPAAAPRLQILDSRESQLAAAFNRNSDKAQLVVVLSPT